MRQESKIDFETTSIKDDSHVFDDQLHHFDKKRK